jgi:hypothetical protein
MEHIGSLRHLSCNVASHPFKLTAGENSINVKMECLQYADMTSNFTNAVSNLTETYSMSGVKQVICEILTHRLR